MNTSQCNKNPENTKPDPKQNLTSSVSMLYLRRRRPFLREGGVSGGTSPLAMAAVNSRRRRCTLWACSMMRERGVRRYSLLTICDRISVHSSSSVCKTGVISTLLAMSVPGPKMSCTSTIHHGSTWSWLCQNSSCPKFISKTVNKFSK